MLLFKNYNNYEKNVFSKRYASLNLTSCESDDDPVSQSQAVVLDVPKYEAEAAKYEFLEGPFRTLELTASGNYIVEMAETRAGGEIFTGEFSVSSGIFVLRGFGSVAVKEVAGGLNIALTTASGAESNYQVRKCDEMSIPSDPEKLCRTWTIDPQCKISGLRVDASTSKIFEKSGCPQELIVTKSGTIFLKLSKGTEISTWSWDAASSSLRSSIIDNLRISFGEVVKVSGSYQGQSAEFTLYEKK